ncbi:hypothetical protein BDZ94DRAFT_1332326 [Collybia nuda]|uniref:DUF6535 domain-containing protein n=1 Tax=Collybia nuda TaxID=64659 RepID=A0A9P6CNF7_9AGAR|nr:hypothetical protein BDZ94DRAFT_1332326 [Collybia nuda]
MYENTDIDGKHDQRADTYGQVIETSTGESTIHGVSTSSKSRRPLPPRPRNQLKDSRRRPLPPTTAQSEIHDVPFSFSSRSSQYTHLHTPGKFCALGLHVELLFSLANHLLLFIDPIKDLFGTQDGIPSDDPIWKSYMDEAQRQDKNTVGYWNQSMDVILIFAGLFSAILTAFIIEFYQSLQPNPQQSTADQLVIITQLLQAGLTGQNAPAPSMRAIDSSDQLFSASSTAIGVNILWFISLTCSLGAAIGAMVIKQWLQFYIIGLSPNAYEYAHQHQYRLNALLAWHVPSIISTLPFIMLVSVGLFLVGLGWQLLQLHITVATVVISFMAIVLLCYVLSLVLSLLYPSCPYKTSALVLL